MANRPPDAVGTSTGPGEGDGGVHSSGRSVDDETLAFVDVSDRARITEDSPDVPEDLGAFDDR